MATRTLTSAALSSMATALVQQPKAIPVGLSSTTPVAFVTATPAAATKYSAPVTIVTCHYNETTREIKAVGSDGNVRVCKIDRLESIEHARQLWTLLKGVHMAGMEIMFASAGGFTGFLCFRLSE